MNWKEVPIPPNMQSLPLDERGFPVPHIVLRDPHGKPVFSANDSRVVAEAKLKRLCGVCGKPLGEDTWVLGGPQSAFHPQGVYIDSPIHHECGAYALQVCPYLAFSGYKHNSGLADKLAERFEGTRIFVNPTQDSTRVPFFVFAKVRAWQCRAEYVIPERPFLAVEYWLEGEQIDQAKAEELLRQAAPYKPAKGSHPNGPDHPVVHKVGDHWHKVAAVLMAAKLNTDHVVLTPQEIEKHLSPDKTIFLQELSDGLHIRYISNEEAQRRLGEHLS